jgi:membrane fusion protein, cation efflux system
VLAHVGHGDEFQATGGTQRVKVNAETDQMLGITTTPIDQSAEGGTGVMIPVAALVDASGKQLVFVQYQDFYEPVEVTTGATKGEMVEISQGLSIGEQLVTQGSLSLYAESRKTQTADAAASPAASPAASSATGSSATGSSATDPASSPAAIASPQSTHAQADAQGIPHSHDNSGNMTQVPSDTPSEQSGSPMKVLLPVGVGAVAVLGTFALLSSNRKKKRTFSSKDGE